MLPGEGAAPLKEPVAGGGALSPLALANKAESVVSVTSQCSFSSTIVHVGDKKPPESGMGVAEGAEPGPHLISQPEPPPSLPSPALWPRMEKRSLPLSISHSLLARQPLLPCLSPTLLLVFLLSIHTHSLGCRVQPRVLPTEGLKARTVEKPLKGLWALIWKMHEERVGVGFPSEEGHGGIILG